MSLTGIVIALCAAGALVVGRLAVLFLRDPAAGLADTTHRAEQLPQVMADRYVMMTALALAAAWFGHPGVIAVLFASFAYMGFHDAAIYARAGHPVTKHVAAGIAAGAVSGLAAFAQFRGGAA
ncbi:hypothetical protein [Lutimaribacter saemankumensis]|uniref:Uncharacterized protein n=1 Tax=Lutimaribacter saemankumensis TaxID=490829 RepID=A0A1G8I4E7_9RHOB|nr:hypothetical protein [Lutimaribacter saemankumensis]SDI13836.1 hypothetical protein SAMN05421850_101765 [Lutimaribacter saemankumensis]